MHRKKCHKRNFSSKRWHNAWCNNSNHNPQ